MNKNTTLVIVGIITLLAGGIIGYLVGSATEASRNTAQEQQQAAIDDSELRAQLNALLREHAAITVPALQSRFSDRPDTQAAFQAVDNNSVAIAELVDSFYGGSRDEFLENWRNHIDYYNDYLIATKAGNDNPKQQARQNLESFADNFSTFFAERDNNINKEDLKQAMVMHNDQVLSIIDALAAEDYNAVYSTNHQAYQHMGDVADMLALAISQR